MVIELIIGLAVVLILAILLVIFRVHTLISVMRGAYTKRVGRSNSINAMMMIIFMVVGLLAFAWYSSVASEHYLPEASTVHGVRTDRMFWITMAILVIAFVVVNIFLLFFAYRYQYREDRKAYFYPENHKLEVVWTVIPAIVMAILVFYGWREWSEITKMEPEDSVQVEIMGKQFAWQVRYPGKDGELGRYHYTLTDATNEMGVDFEDEASLDDFQPMEIRIPKGQPVVFHIRARDVLHSVFVPHFRLKMDAVPGMPTKFWFIPTKTTNEMRMELGDPSFNYELACTEICGRGHFGMRFIVVVVEPEEYERWHDAQQPFAALNADYVRPLLPDHLKDRLEPADVPDTADVPGPGAVQQDIDDIDPDVPTEEDVTAADEILDGDEEEDEGDVSDEVQTEDDENQD
ncbi:cytochrome c oxidase subunit II [Cytophagaceae bacterium ABcell3]|nr:cytochrome c oxidase subunit II [Cytophagaceae bacterium ABcell3]